MYIHQYLQWQHNRVWLGGNLVFETPEHDTARIPQLLYQEKGIAYPKFFKMDLLSKVAFLAAELVVPAVVTADRARVATVAGTGSGCLEVDKRFEESRSSLASPALFVYTLPNIMLGEICIRHGFKGAQVCTVSESPDADNLFYTVEDLLRHRGTQACLCGHLEATEQTIAATLLWVSPSAGPSPFDLTTLQQILSPLS